MFGDVMRIVKPVEVKQRTVKTKGGDKLRSVLNNRVAITEGEATTFIDITAWGGLAELMGQYLRKGSEFYGEGHLKNKTTKVGDDGTEMQTVYLLLDKLKFTYGNKKDEAHGGDEETEY